MGLVAETAPRTASNVVTTTYTKVGLPTTIMYTPHTQNMVCTEGISSSGYGDVHSFDKTVYRMLSMQSDMQTIQLPTVLKDEWDRFLDTATKKTAGTAYDANFEYMNEYLGSLGVTDGVC